MKKIAIVGAGIFGCTIALRLATKGHRCLLYEKNNHIMGCASRVNQYRLHKGYHYPRSDKTIDQLLNSYPKFINEYSDAIERNYEHYYALAREKSLVNRDHYLNFLNKHSLNFEIVDSHPNLKEEKFSLIIKADEHLINYSKLKGIVAERLRNNSLLDVKLNTEFKKNDSDKFDFIIYCGYGLTSKIIKKDLQKNYKFQLIEKIVVSPPQSLLDTSVVIVDGPFMCIDPIPHTKKSILGNVKKAVHQTSFGLEPEKLKPNSRIVPWKDEFSVKNTRFKEFINHGSEYIKEFEKCKFEYSMRGYRVVPINVESTDERISILSSYDKHIEILSGKIDSCSFVADKVAEKIAGM